MKTISDTELAKQLAETRVTLREHRYEAAGSRPKNTNLAKAHRATIARILTEQSRRQKSASRPEASGRASAK